VWGLTGAALVFALLAIAIGLVMPIAAEPDGMQQLWWHLPGARIDQNPVLWLTLGMTKSLAVVTGLLAIAIIATRMRVDAVEARAESFAARWRPLILQRIMGDKVTPPAIEPRDWPHFFVLWNHLHESLRGEALEKLNELAREVGMREVARQWADETELRRQVLAMLALGNMRDPAAWARAKVLIEDEHPVRSVAALRCMLLLRPAAALPQVIPLIARRTDWSPVRIAIFLREAGAELSGTHLAAAAADLPPQEAGRLLKYLTAIGSEHALPTIRQILATAQEPNLIAACLPLLHNAEDMSFARQFIDHPSWFVRVQATVALGKHGKMGDEGLLIPLLADSQWWVRYRAAQALAGMTHLGEGWMRALHDDLTDRYARDIVGQALAEFYR
jgi:HEAT repeat protein